MEDTKKGSYMHKRLSTYLLTVSHVFSRVGVHGLCIVCKRVCYPDDIILNDELLFCIHRTDDRPDKCQSQCHKVTLSQLSHFVIPAQSLRY